MPPYWNLISKVFGALAMIAMVHAFMVWLAVPRPQAWFWAAVIYAGLLAVLYSDWALIDKLRIYFVFVVMTVAGGLTICPCTHAHLFVASIAGIITLIVSHAIKRVLRFGKSHTDNANGVGL